MGFHVENNILLLFQWNVSIPEISCPFFTCSIAAVVFAISMYILIFLILYFQTLTLYFVYVISMLKCLLDAFLNCFNIAN